MQVVPWPIDQHMNPSHGWQPSEHGGDIHYYGQLTTLNDCVYRHMYQSRYVLLNDIDELIAPYQHQTLPQMMDVLQRQNPKVGGGLREVLCMCVDHYVCSMHMLGCVYTGIPMQIFFFSSIIWHI